MSNLNKIEFATSFLAAANIQLSTFEERSFPGESWLIVTVPEKALVAAQSLSGALEDKLNEEADDGITSVVMFRPAVVEVDVEEEFARPGRLAAANVDQLIQLLEARSRTSDALPSLKYMEDPRASLVAIGASRHQLVYGRRGVGKTALLLEAKRLAERAGHLTIWVNAHVLRQLSPAAAFSVIAEMVLSTVAAQAGTSGGATFANIQAASSDLARLRETGAITEAEIANRLPSINTNLRSVLRDGLFRVFIYVDDFYLMPSEVQPVLLDYLAGMFRDCDGWLKIASIERLTRPYEPSTRLGLELPHDASKIDLDVTLEDPAAATKFLQAVLVNYTITAGVGSPSSIAKMEALGRLVLASGGVPRDYLNLFASSIVVARESRSLAREVGREDVAIAAGRSARIKKRDLELDVAASNATELLSALENLAAAVKSAGYAYFRVNFSDKSHPAYELLSLLVDLRFAHLVQASLSDQHKSGIRYEAYVLDLSEFADVRLKRGLHVLDLENGEWTHRLSGQAKSKQRLTGSMLRDRLRKSPLIDLDVLTASMG